MNPNEKNSAALVKYVNEMATERHQRIMLEVELADARKQINDLRTRLEAAEAVVNTDVPEDPTAQPGPPKPGPPARK